MRPLKLYLIMMTPTNPIRICLVSHLEFKFILGPSMHMTGAKKYTLEDTYVTVCHQYRIKVCKTRTYLAIAIAHSQTVLEATYLLSPKL